MLKMEELSVHINKEIVGRAEWESVLQELMLILISTI